MLVTHQCKRERYLEVENDVGEREGKNQQKEK